MVDVFAAAGRSDGERKNASAVNVRCCCTFGQSRGFCCGLAADPPEGAGAGS
jgi:hypothetical protein